MCMNSIRHVVDVHVHVHVHVLVPHYCYMYNIGIFKYACVYNVHCTLCVYICFSYSPYLGVGFLRIQRIVEESIISYFANKAEKTVPDVNLSMRVHTFKCSVYTKLMYMLYL